jgi:hypothetical protein
MDSFLRTSVGESEFPDSPHFEMLSFRRVSSVFSQSAARMRLARLVSWKVRSCRRRLRVSFSNASIAGRKPNGTLFFASCLANPPVRENRPVVSYECGLYHNEGALRA